MDTIRTAFGRLLLRRRGLQLPHWHGTCSLDHRSADEAARCTRTD